MGHEKLVTPRGAVGLFRPSNNNDAVNHPNCASPHSYFEKKEIVRPGVAHVVTQCVSLTFEDKED